MQMIRPRTVAVLAVIALLIVTAPRNAAGQATWQFGFGPSVTITRPDDQRLWGVSGRLRRYPAPFVVAQGYGALHVVHGDGLGGPVISAVGAEIGLTAPKSDRRQTVAWTLSVGGSLVHFAGGQQLLENCAFGNCSMINYGYDPGLVLAGVAALGVEIRTATDMAVYGDARAHIPSRVGSNGFASDPHAAFVSIAIGLIFGY